MDEDKVWGVVTAVGNKKGVEFFVEEIKKLQKVDGVNVDVNCF